MFSLSCHFFGWETLRDPSAFRGSSLRLEDLRRRTEAFGSGCHCIRPRTEEASDLNTLAQDLRQRLAQATTSVLQVGARAVLVALGRGFDGIELAGQAGEGGFVRGAEHEVGHRNAEARRSVSRCDEN